MKKIALLLLAAACALTSTAQIFTTTPNLVFHDGQEVELGMRFKVNPGTQMFTGIRMWKPDTTSGWTVSLWDSAGTRVSTASVPSGKSGFVTVPMTTMDMLWSRYTVSYHTPNGDYGADPNYFTGDKFFLFSPISTSVGAGVYSYSSGYPVSIFQNSNYFVEPVLVQRPNVAWYPSAGQNAVAAPIVEYRDTCKINWAAEYANGGILLNVVVDTLGRPIMPDGKPLKITAKYDSKIKEQFTRTVVITTKPYVTKTYRYSLYVDGAWTKETRNPDGSYTIISY